MFRSTKHSSGNASTRSSFNKSSENRSRGGSWSSRSWHFDKFVLKKHVVICPCKGCAAAFETFRSHPRNRQRLPQGYIQDNEKAFHETFPQRSVADIRENLKTVQPNGRQGLREDLKTLPSGRRSASQKHATARHHVNNTEDKKEISCHPGK